MENPEHKCSATTLLRYAKRAHLSMQMHINSYYDQSRLKLRADISQLQLNDLEATDVDDWVEYFSRPYCLEAISVAPTQPRVVEQPGKSTAYIVLDIDNLDSAIRNMQFTPGTWEHAGEKWSVVDGGLGLDVNPNNHEAIAKSIEAMKSNIGALNAAVEPRNENLRLFVREELERRMTDVKAKRRDVVDLAQALGADLVLSEREQRIRKAAPRLKHKFETLRRPQAKPGQVIRLTRNEFNMILDVIDGGVSSLERTPPVTEKLDEEDIRDLLLSNINGSLNLGAVGEAFSKKGKTDILLAVPEGGVFIAECKFWKGQATIDKATRQILDYLTWKDAFGVVVLFSRNLDFSKTLRNVPQAISKLDSLKGKVHGAGERHWTSQHSLPTDVGHTVELHHLVYNFSP